MAALSAWLKVPELLTSTRSPLLLPASLPSFVAIRSSTVWPDCVRIFRLTVAAPTDTSLSADLSRACASALPATESAAVGAWYSATVCW